MLEWIVLNPEAQSSWAVVERTSSGKKQVVQKVSNRDRETERS